LRASQHFFSNLRGAVQQRRDSGAVVAWQRSGSDATTEQLRRGNGAEQRDGGGSSHGRARVCLRYSVADGAVPERRDSGGGDRECDEEGRKSRCVCAVAAAITHFFFFFFAFFFLRASPTLIGYWWWVMRDGGLSGPGVKKDCFFLHLHLHRFFVHLHTLYENT